MHFRRGIKKWTGRFWQLWRYGAKRWGVIKIARSNALKMFLYWYLTLFTKVEVTTSVKFCNNHQDKVVFLITVNWAGMGMSTNGLLWSVSFRSLFKRTLALLKVWETATFYWEWNFVFSVWSTMKSLVSELINRKYRKNSQCKFYPPAIESTLK